METLREIRGKWLTLYDMLRDPQEDIEAIRMTLEAIEGELEWKADCYADIIDTLTETASHIKAEEDRLKARRTALENRAGWLKRQLEETMKLTGKTKFKTDLYSFNIQKNPPAVKYKEGFDIYDAPTEFLKYKDPEIDGTKVKEALKAGQELGWAWLEQTEGLRIR